MMRRRSTGTRMRRAGFAFDTRSCRARGFGNPRPPQAVRPTPRPATRVDNWILYPGGGMREMTIRDRIAWKFGRRVFPR